MKVDLVTRIRHRLNLVNADIKTLADNARELHNDPNYRVLEYPIDNLRKEIKSAIDVFDHMELYNWKSVLYELLNKCKEVDE